jgi:hypothetical protein
MTVSPPLPLATVLGTAVEFTDADGESWRVTERDCRSVPGARGARCLVFMSDFVFRRVWKYPATWRTLSAAALTELSWRQ